MTAIRDAILGAGGPASVARQCKVSVQAVCFWRDGRRALPAEHCPTLERLNEGRIRCEDMRPDVDWAYLRGTPAVSDGHLTDAQRADVDALFAANAKAGEVSHG